MSKELIEKTANEVGESGFIGVALEGVKKGDSTAAINIAISFLTALKPEKFSISINESNSNAFHMLFVSDFTNAHHNYRIPLGQEVSEQYDEVLKMFSALSLEMSFKRMEVSHAKRVQ